MARVQGPLLSLSASKSVGGALTFKTWKGINVCSIKSQPSNPKTIDQMKGRAYFAGGGKITKKAELIGDVVTFVKGIIPAGQSWASYFVREMMGTQNVNIEAAKTYYNTGGNATIKGYFDDAATQAAIEAVDLDGTANTQLSAGLLLLAAYSASKRLSDPSAPEALASVNEAHVFAYTQALTGILPA
jgi:hypothetical protein